MTQLNPQRSAETNIPRSTERMPPSDRSPVNQKMAGEALEGLGQNTLGASPFRPQTAGEKISANNSVDQLLGTKLSISDPQTKQFSSTEAGDLDRSSHHDEGIAKANASESLTSLVKAQQQSTGAEKHSIAARVAASTLATERTRTSSRIKNNKLAETSNSKRVPGNDRSSLPAKVHELSSIHNTKGESADHNSGSRQPEQHPIHKADNSAQHNFDKAHKPESTVNHKIELTDTHKTDSATNQKLETQETQKTDSKIAKEEPKSSKSPTINEDRKNEAAKTAEQSIKPTAQLTNEVVVIKREEHAKPDKEEHITKQPESTAQVKEQPETKQPEHFTQTKQPEATKHVDQATPDKEKGVVQQREPTQAPTIPEKQNQPAAAITTAKSTDSNNPQDQSRSLPQLNPTKSADEKADTRTPAQTSVPASKPEHINSDNNEIRLAAKEQSIKEERSQKSPPRENMDDDHLDLHELHALHLAGQDHAPGHDANVNPADTSSHHLIDIPTHSLDRSSVSDHTHAGEINKGHSPTHTSITPTHSGRLDSIHIAHEPEVQTNHKGTMPGGSASTTTGTNTIAGSSHNGHDPLGHSGHSTAPGHNAGGHMKLGHTHDPRGQNTGSKTGTNTTQSSNQNNQTTTSTGADSTGKNTGNNSQTGSTKTPDPPANTTSNPSGSDKNRQPANSQTNNPANPTTLPNQPANGTTPGYYGPVAVEWPSNNGYREAAFLLELFAEIGFMAALNNGRHPSRLADITNPAIPGNMIDSQPYINQPGSPFNSQASPVNFAAGANPDISTPTPTIPAANSPNSIIAQNPVAENSIGLNLNPVISEPTNPAGTTIDTGANASAGKIPPAVGGDAAAGQNPSGSNISNPGPSANNPLLPESPISGQTGNLPVPNGNPYLTGSVDYWGNNPGSIPNSTPGTGNNQPTLSPEYGSYDRSPPDGQPYHSGHVESADLQSPYAAHADKDDSNNDNRHHDKHVLRPEISDPWQLSVAQNDKIHHVHEAGNSTQDKHLDNQQQHRHDLLPNDWWHQQNGSKHTQTGGEIQPNNGNKFPVLNENLIGQLVALLTDAKKNKDPKQQGRTYTVKDGDTLESIAASVLFDYKLGQLIYIINKAILPSQSDWQKCKLREGLVLFLPAQEEINCFRLALSEKEKQTNNANLDQETLNNLAKRRSNVERLLGSLSNLFSAGQTSLSGREKTTVRLGDTLRSIALKHPSLSDVSLWKLLAQLNELSLNVDVKGVPTAILTRGMTLELPTANEIADYRANQASSTRASSPRKALQAEVLA